MSFYVATRKPKAIVIDIEGTTAPIAFVKETLFPFARARMREFIQTRLHDENLKDVLQNIIQETLQHIKNTNTLNHESPEQDLETAVTALCRWSDEDLKIKPLKDVQGLIWLDGYEQKTIKAPLYEDAYRVMDAWHRHGIPLYVYSSGSKAAQLLFYRHTTFGDVTFLFHDYFDTSIGGKLSAASYSAILEKLRQTQTDLQGSDVLFISDHGGELDAAQQAGWMTVLCRRPEDQPLAAPLGEQAHSVVNSFARIHLEPMRLIQQAPKTAPKRSKTVSKSDKKT